MFYLLPGTRVKIHYAAKNQKPDKRWRDIVGTVICQGKGPGPKNVLVNTHLGKVVVPRGNVRRV